MERNCRNVDNAWMSFTIFYTLCIQCPSRIATMMRKRQRIATNLAVLVFSARTVLCPSFFDAVQMLHLGLERWILRPTKSYTETGGDRPRCCSLSRNLNDSNVSGIH